MFRTIRIVTIGAALAALFAGSTDVSAQTPGPGGRGRGPGAVSRGPSGVALPLRDLDLTDAQRQQIRQLTQQYREQSRATLDRLRQAQEARRQVVEVPPVDEARIRAVMQELAEAETELALQRARLNSDVHAVLTPEQQERARQVREEREARRKERREQMQKRIQERTRRRG